MYTIEDLEHGISRLKELRMLLLSPKCNLYCHDFWFVEGDCGSPSCALGWSTILWPKELQELEGGILNTVTGNHGCTAGRDAFRLSNTLAYYLFGTSTGAAIERRDDSLIETLRRFDVVERYLRRRLATLLAEEEQRQVRRQRRRQRQTVSA